MRFLVILCLIGQTTLSVVSASPAQPNIVLLVSDDMGWNDVGYHGGTAATPNLDRLATEGIQLERFYVHPICSPTRTAMMTGRTPSRFGITAPVGGHQGVPVEEHFLPQTFSAAGYQCFMTGKWHLGIGEGMHPLDRGFDHFYGHLGGAIDYFTHTGGRGGNVDWFRNRESLVEEGYSTYLFATEALHLLAARDREKPVFLYVPFNAPHNPPQAPAKLVEKNGSDRSGLRNAAIEAMDIAIGRILKGIDDEGMTDNTLVMFFCDNGGPGQMRGGGKGKGRPQSAPNAGADESSDNSRRLALRAGKGSVYEGGIRVPAIIRWPGKIEPGSSSEQFISATDLLPSLASAAKIDTQNTVPLDGCQVWEAMATGAEVTRDHPIVIAGPRESWAILQTPWKLVKPEGAQPELYQILKDPTESKNVAEEHPDVLSQMSATLDKVVSQAVIRRSSGPGGGKSRPGGKKGSGRRPTE